MKRIILIALLLAGCTNADRALPALQAAGYSNIQFTGYSWFSCSEDDFFATGFAAKGSNGQPVEGTVCAGMFKGQTIRLD